MNAEINIPIQREEMTKIKENSCIISHLTPWLERKCPGIPYADDERARTFLEYGGFIGIDAKYPIHESYLLPAQGLEQSWTRTRAYVDSALGIIKDDSPGWLDREEVEMIKEELGEPPAQCYPIYFISVGNDDNEKLVYVGKTSSSNGRFSGGHAAITKLHHPDYSGLEKNIYLGCITLLTDEKKTIPLELVNPIELATKILKSAENQLIYRFKPPLNTHGINNNRADMPFSIHIQNFISQFLNDSFVYPPADT